VPLAVYSMITATVVAAAFGGVFPAAFIEGQGLTPFKVTTEYAVIGMTILGAIGLYHRRDKIAADVVPPLLVSMACTVVAELAFTLYGNPFGAANRIGHAAHFAAFALIYSALVQTSLERPFETLFHQLKLRESELAEAYTVEHRIAETLQDAMAIHPMRVPGLQLAHRYLPSPGAGRIGGDFYDVFLISDGLAGFAIGDVCGKGIEAAMTNMKSRSALRAAALDDSDPSKVLEAVNGYLHRELASDSFVTAVFGTIHTSSGHVRLASAGHPEPVVCCHPEVVLPDELRGPPLGVVPHLGAQTWEFDLAPGESLVLVTDGLLEAGGTQSQFGSERLSELLHGLPCSSAHEIVDAVLKALDEHAGSEFDDDIAIVALQRSE
jgi:serine phosphatase RsbU (regulator of sigma subunit)